MGFPHVNQKLEKYTYKLRSQILTYLEYDSKVTTSDGEDLVLVFGTCGVSLHCYYSQIHSDPEW